MCKETCSRYAKCRHRRVRRTPCDKELYNRTIRHTWRAYLACLYPERHCATAREKLKFKGECDRCLGKTADACVEAKAAARRYDWPSTRRDSYIDPVTAEGLTRLAGLATGDGHDAGGSRQAGKYYDGLAGRARRHASAASAASASASPASRLPNLRVFAGEPVRVERMDAGLVSPLSLSDMGGPRRPVSLLEEER